ncbi:MAG: DUF262 domain-containing protein [Mycobacteriales bacterium]
MALTDSTTDLLLPRLLRIPDYQRGYAWEREHVQDFLDDLALLVPAQKHYTGTVVLLGSDEHVIDDQSQVLLRADVVDGQQRLTTVCLLLNELRRALASQGLHLAADGLTRQFLLIHKDGIALPKLQVGDESKPIWMALLTDTAVPVPETLSSRRLLAASEQIRSHVDALVDKDATEPGNVTRLRDLVIQSLQFTVYTLQRSADVGVIFETLNDRGKPLTELEKVKNYLLFLAARLPEAKQAALAARINDVWSRVYRLLLEVARVSPAVAASI